MSMNDKTNESVVNGNNTYEEMDVVGSITNGSVDKDLCGDIKQTEILRCFAQYLLDKNYKDTYDKLVTESGVVLENTNVASLRESVLSGNWSRAEEALHNLKLEVNSEDNLRQMQFLILEQRILEAYEETNFGHGVNLLRQHLTPMNLNSGRVHLLASCLMYNDVTELHNMTSWKGKDGGSREILVNKLQDFIPAQVMLPPNRLESLLSMAAKHQIINCTFHNRPVDIDNQSLLQDHDCGQENFPSCVVQDINGNNNSSQSDQNELWVCKFSPDGLRLAVGGKERNVQMFSVNLETLRVQKQTELQCTGHLNDLAWSYDSKKLAASASANIEEQGSFGVFVFDVVEEKCICNVRLHEDEPFNCVAFLKDNNKLAVGNMKGLIRIVDVSNQGNVLATIDGYRAQSLVVLHTSNPSPRTSSSISTSNSSDDFILVADSHKRIREYHFSYDDDTQPDNNTSSNGMLATASGDGTLLSATAISSTNNNSTSTLTATNPSIAMTTSQDVSATDLMNTSAVTMIAAISNLAANTTSNSPNPSPSSQQASPTTTTATSTLLPTTTTTTASDNTTTATTTNPPVVLHPSALFQWVSTGSANAAVNTTSTTPTSTTTSTITTTRNWLPNTTGSVALATSSTLDSTLTTVMNLLGSQHRHSSYSLVKDRTLFEADASVHAIVLSKNADKLLVSLNKIGLCMWDLQSCQILRRYVGAEQKKYTLFPTFGGYEERFIACGSETGMVTIWHVDNSIPVQQVLLIPGSNISSVHWNPAHNAMLAAVNDAGHIYILGPSKNSASSTTSSVLCNSKD